MLAHLGDDRSHRLLAVLVQQRREPPLTDAQRAELGPHVAAERERKEERDSAKEAASSGAAYEELAAKHAALEVMCKTLSGAAPAPAEL